MAFRIALSGLAAATTDLEVTGNNIANSSTTGFKESRAEFADIFASSISDASNATSGQGVRTTKVAQQFRQGSIEFTANNLDLGINGEGFFTMEQPNGDRSYTRAGAFNVDRNGYVVDHTGSRLQIFPPVDADGTSFNTGTTVDLNLPVVSGAPGATSQVTASLNLGAAEDVPTVAFNAASYPPNPLS
ncbi:flagellar basal body FlaE domain protein [endosymbiont of Tevnia jerichonana (vent Tica)]|jgi:flagellar hook protein FlgE|nr:flagellar basal body FlaE domain protein [endosymbiont of Tevnia jerichonana (vent Tica)]